MKKIWILLFLLSFICCVRGQKSVLALKVIPCPSDRLWYDSFLSELDSLGIVRILEPRINHDTLKAKIFNLSESNLNKIKARDYCAFLLYVAIFDRLINDGLDLNYDYAKNHPFRMSVMGPSLDESISNAYKENNIKREKRRIYENFLKIKSYYEEYIIQGLAVTKKRNKFRQLIESIILSGSYNEPELLRNILLSKYRHLTHQKLDKDFRKYYRKYLS